MYVTLSVWVPGPPSPRRRSTPSQPRSWRSPRPWPHWLHRLARARPRGRGAAATLGGGKGREWREGRGGVGHASRRAPAPGTPLQTRPPPPRTGATTRAPRRASSSAPMGGWGYINKSDAVWDQINFTPNGATFVNVLGTPKTAPASSPRGRDSSKEGGSPRRVSGSGSRSSPILRGLVALSERDPA